MSESVGAELKGESDCNKCIIRYGCIGVEVKRIGSEDILSCLHRQYILRRDYLRANKHQSDNEK